MFFLNYTFRCPINHFGVSITQILKNQLLHGSTLIGSRSRIKHSSILLELANIGDTSNASPSLDGLKTLHFEVHLFCTLHRAQFDFTIG